MKRGLIGALIVTMVLAAGVATAYAAGPGRGRNDVGANRAGICGLAGSQCNWQDANGDGICDNCGRNAVGCSGYADQDGDGVCDNCGMGRSHCQQGGCPGYVDLDGDRVCDNRGISCRQGACRSQGYVDQDGDGVCDNRMSGCHGGGHGKGCRG